jgi:hypothetical protein
LRNGRNPTAITVSRCNERATGGKLLALGLYRLATGGPVVGFDQLVLREALIPKRSRWRPWHR